MPCFTPADIDTARLAANLHVLAEDIGVRLAGAPQEARAADWIRAQFAECGAPTRLETFPVLQREVRREQLDVCIDGTWLAFPCSLFSSTPGTDGLPVEAPLCFFEATAEYRRPDLSHLRGKAVVHLGCHIESRADYRRLIEADPAFLLFVDIRYPGTAALADGMFPAYTRAVGAKPTVNVAYMDAWRWRREGASAARLSVEGGMRPSISQNVIAELPGTERAAETLFVVAHHDTQAGSVGADDNASGVMAVLELARLLAPRPRRRSLRLISFGAEEQLSVGSAEYVRAHRQELERTGRFLLNFDAFGSWLGWNLLTVNGPPAMTEFVLPFYDRAGLYPATSTDIMPYGDHFPFLAAQVPGMWVHRPNCSAGRFFHHRSDDDPSVICLETMAAHIACAANLLDTLATGEDLPFDRTIPDDQTAQVARYWEDLFGGWSPAR